jgi:hypothetical protein
LVVGGGGSGGANGGGGGGAGGVATGAAPVSVGSYPVVIGSGGTSVTGTSKGVSGLPSSFNNISAPGGGAGGGWYSLSSPTGILPSIGGSGGGGAGATSSYTQLAALQEFQVLEMQEDLQLGLLLPLMPEEAGDILLLGLTVLVPMVVQVELASRHLSLAQFHTTRAAEAALRVAERQEQEALGAVEPEAIYQETVSLEPQTQVAAAEDTGMVVPELPALVDRASLSSATPMP